MEDEWYADEFFHSIKSINDHSCAIVIYNGEYCWAKPLITKSGVGGAAQNFVPRVSMPKILTTDGAPELIGRRCLFHAWFQRHVSGMP